MFFPRRLAFIPQAEAIKLVSWCFKPSQPQRIIPGLRETFIKRCRVERTNKAAKDRKHRVRKRKVVGRIYGMKYCWKGHENINGHKSRIKRSGQARLVCVKDINRNIPTTSRCALRDDWGEQCVEVTRCCIWIGKSVYCTRHALTQFTSTFIKTIVRPICYSSVFFS